jgi:hypothetical protein
VVAHFGTHILTKFISVFIVPVVANKVKSHNKDFVVRKIVNRKFKKNILTNASAFNPKYLLHARCLIPPLAN